MLDSSWDQKEFMVTLTEARNEWVQAQGYFENVSEPDLVDYAIYRMEAARRRYMYLIKQARILGFEGKDNYLEDAEEMHN